MIIRDYRIKGCIVTAELDVHKRSLAELMHGLRPGRDMDYISLGMRRRSGLLLSRNARSALDAISASVIKRAQIDLCKLRSDRQGLERRNMLCCKKTSLPDGISSHYNAVTVDSHARALAHEQTEQRNG